MGRICFGILMCVALAGCAGDPVVEDGNWTSSLGHYTRTLDDFREAVAAAQAPASSAELNWALPYPARVTGYYYDWANLYIDTSRLADLRYLERTVAQLTNHPFPSSTRPLCNMRSPDFYQENRWMMFNLRANEYYRTIYSNRWHDYYTPRG